MELFIFEGFTAGGNTAQASEGLAKHSLEIFGIGRGTETAAKNIKIERTENGKPYSDTVPWEFSVSHTGQLWICAVSERTVGIDIQEIRSIDHEKLADRFFTEAEKKYCRTAGKEGFFNIWTRKESIVKYMGTTLGKGISSIETVIDGTPADRLIIDGAVIHMTEIEIGADIKCAAAAEETGEICIKTLN